ncbi:MAG: patatin-like phospholipase family protein [Calditrichia bacterium]
MADIIRILSIDGGGIRGIIPAMVLNEIEKQAGKPISELFDLIAGTSTGGILALGLTRPNGSGKAQFSAEDFIELYEKEGKRIFSRSFWHRVRAMGNLGDERYPADGLEELLNKYFENTPLRDALTPLIISSYEIEQRFPFFFRSARAKENAAYDFPMKKVARATSAAPTYFEPLKLETSETVGYYALVDGGVFANNPAMCAYVEGRDIYPEKKDFLLVSLGTGELTRPLLYEEAKNWGLVGWAQPLLSVVFDGVSDTVDYQLKQLLAPKRNQPRYYRFQVRLSEGNDDMDDAGPTNLRVLKLLAEEMIHQRAKEIKMLVRQLTG